MLPDASMSNGMFELLSMVKLATVTLLQLQLEFTYLCVHALDSYDSLGDAKLNLFIEEISPHKQGWSVSTHPPPPLTALICYSCTLLL